MKLQYTAVVFEDLMLQVKSTQMQMAQKQWLQSRKEHWRNLIHKIISPVKKSAMA